MKRIASFFLALALAFSLTACTVPVEKADDGKIQIVATLFPYYDFARAIVGDRADVTLLLRGAKRTASSPRRSTPSRSPNPMFSSTTAARGNTGSTVCWALQAKISPSSPA